MKSLVPIAAVPLLAFLGGFTTHFLYNRWNPASGLATQNFVQPPGAPVNAEPQSHPVTYQANAKESRAELPQLLARDVDKLRELAGNRARVRGRVFRIGHSAKSNTYFLNFGPSREALTAIIFASAVESFELQQLAPKRFEGKEVEIVGVVKDHPKYGLEIILEHPSQISIVN